MNSEYLASDPYSETLMNTKFVSWLLNVMTKNCRMSRVGRLLLDGNPNGYELADHIAKKMR